MNSGQKRKKGEREDLMWGVTAGLVQGAKFLEELIRNFLGTIVMGGIGHEICIITLIKREEGITSINTLPSVSIHLEFLKEHHLKKIWYP